MKWCYNIITLFERNKVVLYLCDWPIKENTV